MTLSTQNQEPDAPLMLSVSGMRGLVGRSLTPDVVARYAAAFGHWLGASLSVEAPAVVLGRDSRPSGEMFEAAAVAGLLAAGCRVTQLGIVSTPAVAVMARHLHAHGGMVITASHNPIVWNGVKPLRHDGVAPPPDQAQAIIDAFRADAAHLVGVDQLQPLQRRDDAVAVHCDAILPHIDVDAIRAARLKAVVDSVHGAGGDEARALLDHLGVECVHLYPEPTGRFPHPPEPTRENLAGLCDAVREHAADLGFAQDPDADRLAIVDNTGAYIGEEYTLALAADHLLQPGDVAVANLSTSRMIDDIAAARGASIRRTPVGEANVVRGMAQADAVVGGEGNGGVIWARVVPVRDSLVGMALVLEMLARRRRPLSDVVADLPAYAIVKDKVPFDADAAGQLAPVMQQAFADQRIDLQDGVRVDWPDRWVHVRASNTEPILRVIAEAHDPDAARQLIDDVKARLRI